jgi:DNA-binding transcriptional regulator YiaG
MDAEATMAPPEMGQEPMTPDELKAFRKRHGLTRAQVAILAGVAAGTVRNWEQEGSGRRGMPAPADLLLRRATRADIARVKRDHPPKHPAALVGDEE